jgi:hypothetical protein
LRALVAVPFDGAPQVSTTADILASGRIGFAWQGINLSALNRVFSALIPFLAFPANENRGASATA